MNVPILDLARAHARFAPELARRWQRVLDSNAYVLGPEVRELEEGFASFLGAAGCVAVGNGTDALVIALRALGLRPGDEVIVPAFSFFATAEAVLLLGGVPVFADIEAATFNLDPVDALARVTPRTVGVIGVHLYGRPFDFAGLESALAERRLWLLEDAAQAQGATWRGRRVGTLGRLAAWSFYPTKNFGCFGDGGAISGPDAALLAEVRLLANHGQTERYRHVTVGTNSRLDSLQAAVLNCRLPLLDADNARRRAIAGSYQQQLAGVGDLSFPVDAPDCECVYHQMTVRTARRDELQAFLATQGVASAVHYPSPLHQQAAVTAVLGPQPELPAATRAAREVLCLPIFPELSDDQVDVVASAVTAFFAG